MSSGRPAFHGYAPGEEPADEGFFAPMTVTVSRDTGARGRFVAQRTAERLGWEYVDQEHLDYLSQGEEWGVEPMPAPPPEVASWITTRIDALHRAGFEPSDERSARLARLFLEQAGQGSRVLLSRGAGHVLPPGSQVFVHVTAPMPERVAYVAELKRLSPDDARRHIERRDLARQEFVRTAFGAPADLAERFDLVVNASSLGIDGAAGLIVEAVRAKESRRAGPS